MEYGKRLLIPKAVIQMIRIVVLRQAANGQKRTSEIPRDGPILIPSWRYFLGIFGIPVHDLGRISPSAISYA